MVMEDQAPPGYAIFDDYRATQRILVWVRWVIVAFALYANNIRPTFDPTYLFLTNLILGGEILLNVYLHRQVHQTRRISLPVVLVACIVDATGIMLITTFSETPAFTNPFFVTIFPIVIAYALVLPQRLGLAYTIAVSSCYGVLSLMIAPEMFLPFPNQEQKVLVARILMILVVGVVSSAIVQMERTMRRQAVQAERYKAEENLELQRRAQQAELEAQTERSRIAREIHDGIAQSIYMLSLNLETVADVVASQNPDLAERLKRLVQLSKQTLLETRHYIFDLKPLLTGDISLTGILENLAREFQAVTSIPVEVKVEGSEPDMPLATAASLYRVTQEALANVYKHAQASRVVVKIEFQLSGLALWITDDGRGLPDTDINSRGYGLQNMRQRVEELGGSINIEGSPGQGTAIRIEVPIPGIQPGG
jgi:signal transduction histidine kinase